MKLITCDSIENLESKVGEIFRMLITQFSHLEIKAKIDTLRQRVKETKDQTDKARVDTERLQKLNDRICKYTV